MANRITQYTRAGLSFPVTDTGPLDGETIVLLHGFPQTAHCWAATAEQLNEQGFRTIVPVMRGYARSATPARRWNYRISELQADTAELLRITGPAHLVGHDWGAAVAWQVAAGHPDLVRTLSSVSVPHPLAFLRSFLRSNQAVKSYYMYLFQIPFLPELLAARFPTAAARFLRATRMPDSAVATTLDEIVRPGLLGGGLGYYRGLPFTAIRPNQSRVAAPVTHIWSTGDAALSRAGADLTSDYVDGPFRLVVLDGASHWIPD